MKTLKKICFSLFFILAISATFNAQDTLSAEKRKLIGELIVLTKADEQAQSMMNLMLISSENSLQESIKSTIQKTEMTADQKAELEKRLIADQSRFTARFRERFQKEISVKKYLEETMYPLYGKFFSESELADIVNFYKSPTGRKMIEQMPELMKESFKLAEEKLLPQVRKITESIFEEELKEYNSEPPLAAKTVKR